MLAIELVKDGKDPDQILTAAINVHCHQHGVITLTAGTYGNVLRFLPPLSTTDALLTEALDILEAAF